MGALDSPNGGSHIPIELNMLFVEAHAMDTISTLSS